MHKVPLGQGRGWGCSWALHTWAGHSHTPVGSLGPGPRLYLLCCGANRMPGRLQQKVKAHELPCPERQAHGAAEALKSLV